jgi:hypothetical protein
MASFTINASTGEIVDAFFADAPMNGSIIELPALASELGLSQTVKPGKAPGSAAVPSKDRFTYRVNAFSLTTGAVDTTGSATLSPFNPALSSGDFATLGPGASTSFTLTVDQSQLATTPALGWLVVSVDDASGAAQAAEVSAPASN